MRKTVATLTAVLALAGCGAGASGSAESSPSPSSYVPGRFEAAKITCRAASPLSDGGKTLTFDTKGEEDTSGDSIDDMWCVLTKLKITTAVTSHMESTRALDGQQTDEWDGVKARWTYHPDSGVGLTLGDTT